MARLKGQEKMGYYPTPSEVVEILKEMLVFPASTVRVLDPCCGTGEALAAICEGKQVESYGIELEKARAERAKEVLDNVLICDALTEAEVGKNGYQILLLNPPYDTEAVGELEKGERLELKFLTKFTQTLGPDGILVLIVPYYVLNRLAPYIGIRYTDVSCFRFPEGLFEEFKQVVLIARRTRQVDKLSKKKTTEFLKRASVEPGALQELRPVKTYEIPPAGGKKPRFVSHRLELDEALAVVEKDGLWKEIRASVEVRKRELVRPLTTLRQGHLAMLLAGGFLNGLIEKDGRKLVVKGLTQKHTSEREEKTDSETIRRETTSHRVVIRAFDLEAKEFFTIS